MSECCFVGVCLEICVVLFWGVICEEFFLLFLLWIFFSLFFLYVWVGSAECYFFFLVSIWWLKSFLFCLPLLGLVIRYLSLSRHLLLLLQMFCSAGIGIYYFFIVRGESWFNGTPPPRFHSICTEDYRQLSGFQLLRWQCSFVSICGSTLTVGRSKISTSCRLPSTRESFSSLIACFLI